MTNLQSAAESVRRAITEACHGLVERETLVELVVLAAVAQEHMLVVGPPGTGKSEAVRRIARRFGGRYFEYLIGRFTEPTEIFGPVNLSKLRQGVGRDRDRRNAARSGYRFPRRGLSRLHRDPEHAPRHSQ
jgi:MoxR-like ATPase